MPRYGDLSIWLSAQSAAGHLGAAPYEGAASYEPEPRRTGDWLSRSSGLGVTLTVAAASALGAALAFAAIDAPIPLEPATHAAATAEPIPHQRLSTSVANGAASVRAERTIIVSSDATPTTWRGAKAVRARRTDAPIWAEGVRLALAGTSSLPIDLALTTPPQVVSVDAPPLWSPYLAEQRENEGEIAAPDMVAGLSVDAEAVVPNEIATGAYETAAIEAAAFSAPPAAAPSPQRRSDRVDAVLAAARSIDDPSTTETENTFADGPIAMGAIATGAIPASTRVEAPQSTAETAPAPSTDPVVDPRNPPTVSIVLTAFGLNNAASSRALDRLPPEIAVAVAPVGDAPEHWTARARRNGRITLVEAPMEPSAYPRVNPGPLTLLTSLSADDNIRRFERVLAKAPSVDGVSTYLGDRFLKDENAVRPVLEAAARRNLSILENGGGSASVLASLGEDYGLAVRRRSVSLDRDGRTRDIELGLEQLEAAARRDGYAVGVGVTMPSTIDGLVAWARRLEERGIRLAPLRL